MVIAKELLASFFERSKLRFGRCLAPGMTCEKPAIRSHSIQNAQALDLLVRDGHVKALTRKIDRGSEPVIDFNDVGRHQAATFSRVPHPFFAFFAKKGWARLNAIFERSTLRALCARTGDLYQPTPSAWPSKLAFGEIAPMRRNCHRRSNPPRQMDEPSYRFALLHLAVSTLLYSLSRDDDVFHVEHLS